VSDSQAIGGVSATIKAVLEDRMEIPTGVSDVRITIGLPRSDQPEGTGVEHPRVNVFLYRVTRNQGLTQEQLPGRGVRGAYGNPPLSLDLHYLLTGYGTVAIDDEFFDEITAQFLLGSAMRVLHDHPVLSDGLRSVRAPIGRQLLHKSLRGEVERVKLTLDPLTIEDLSKVWTAITLPYRTSAAYTATVVQIESRRIPRSPRLVGDLPDGGPRVTVTAQPWPRIDRIAIRHAGDEPGSERIHLYARIGDTLILHGQAFGDAPLVTVGETGVTATLATSTTVEVEIPDLPALVPGAQPVRLQRVAGLASNVVAFLLVPAIESVAIAGEEITIAGERLFHPDLDCFALIGDRMVPSEDWDDRTATEIVVPVPAEMPAGTYPVRVRVNDEESIDERTVDLP
jgi:Pvc16 N-terminal domain